MIALAEQGVRSLVVRLPPTVHGVLDHHGFIPVLISIARATGVAGYLGDGDNRWPAADTRDVGRLYRLALENAPAGSRVPVASIAAEDAERHLALDVRAAWRARALRGS